MRTTTWANIGKDVSKSNSVEDVLRNAGLDFEVTTQPLVTESGIIIPNKVATVATIGDESKVLGVVSKNYNICQNKDAFEFVDTISDELEFERAGMTHTGMVYVIARLPEVDVLGDAFTPYTILQNSFNGEYSLKATICPLRIVCQNQFSYAFGHSTNNVSILHSNNMINNMAQANELLKGTATYLTQFSDYAETYATMKLSKSPEDIIHKFFEQAQTSISQRAEAKTEENSQLVLAAYNEDDNQNFKGTVWGLMNAFSDYTTHKPATSKRSTEDSKFLNVTFNPTLFQNFVNFVQSEYTR